MGREHYYGPKNYEFLQCFRNFFQIFRISGIELERFLQMLQRSVQIAVKSHD